MKAKEKEKIVKTKSEQDLIIEGLRKLGRRAYDTALANGVPVTVLRGNNVCKIEPGGKVAVVTRMRQTKIKASSRKYKL